MPLLRKDQFAGVLQDEESRATTLLVICIDQFGTEMFKWEPETFNLEVKRAFSVDMPAGNRDKLWALITAMTTNLFYISLESFMPICNALNDSEADFQHYDPVTSEEAAWGITEVLLVDPPKDGEDPANRFSHEIKRYIGLTLESEGVTTPPKVLKNYVEVDKPFNEEEVGAIIGPDESILKMYMDRQKSEQADIEKYVNDRLDQLAAQLQALPLVHGSTDGLVDHLRQVRAAAIATPQPEESIEPSPLALL